MATEPQSSTEQEKLRGVPGRILSAVSEYVQGKNDLVRLLTVSLLSSGHVLVEGLPGTAKTLLARSFAQAIGGEFRRIQLTPDLLPADITGFNLYRPDGSSEFVQGPLFANVVMADELNRTTPRTQSAFLEAMQERQVTIEGTTYPLPHPFLVVASQVPYGGEGTFQLADVQVDRFSFRVWSGYPDRQAETHVLELADVLEQPRVEPVTTPETILELRELARKVHVSDLVLSYILDLVESLRSHDDVLRGPSPRASLALYRGSRALALIEDRDYVVPDDIRTLAPSVLEHRVRLTAEAELEEVTPEALVQGSLESVPVPKGAVGV